MACRICKRYLRGAKSESNPDLSDFLPCHYLWQPQVVIKCMLAHRKESGTVEKVNEYLFELDPLLLPFSGVPDAAENALCGSAVCN